jgi:putative transposase
MSRCWRRSALAKAADVVAVHRAIKHGKAAERVEANVTNNPVERLLKEARRRTKVVGAFPDGQSALMLVAARPGHVSTASWGLRKFMNMD